LWGFPSKSREISGVILGRGPEGIEILHIGDETAIIVAKIHTEGAIIKWKSELQRRANPSAMADYSGDGS
jgi:hypothetical protein